MSPVAVVALLSFTATTAEAPGMPQGVKGAFDT